MPLDIIVVGAGISGLSAALEAARGGARVLVLDTWSVFGGHAVMAEGALCIVGSPVQERSGIRDTPEIAFRDFTTYGEDADTEWVRDYVTNSRVQIYDWLTSLGVAFGELRQPAGNSVPRYHEVRGRGLGLVSPIYRECVRHATVTFEWNTRVTALVEERGHVVGVRGENLRTGKTVERRSRAVILATGGFQSNLDLVREFWPKTLPFPERLLIGSGVNSVGSGLAIARDVGAALDRLDHQWNYATGLPDPRHPGGKRGLNVRIPKAIWLNAQGHRFVNEAASHRDKLSALLAQRPATYWAIFDEGGKAGFYVAGSDWADFDSIERWIFSDPSLVKSAPTLEALAEVAGLPPAEVVAAVRRTNEMVRGERDADFGRVGTSMIAPLTRIESPPFYAVQLFPLTRKSMGGVRIDRSTRALDGSAHFIPGLYAVGELAGLAGINGKAGLEGTFLGPSIFTGRVAGRAAVAELGLEPPAPEPQPASAPRQVPAVPSSDRPDCLACHPIASLVNAARPGYSHFEAAHTRVLEQSLPCALCHAEMAPYRDTAHHADAERRIATCAQCHVSTAQ